MARGAGGALPGPAQAASDASNTIAATRTARDTRTVYHLALVARSRTGPPASRVTCLIMHVHHGVSGGYGFRTRVRLLAGRAALAIRDVAGHELAVTADAADEHG